MTGVFFSETLTSVALQDANKRRQPVSAAARKILYFCRVITSSQIPRPAVRFVRLAAIRRARGTHLRPIFQGRRAGTAQNKTDDTDYLSIRLVYRRLDTSSPLEATAGAKLQRGRSFDQYSSFDESDRTCAAHGIQADGHALTSRADDGGYFAMGQGDIYKHAFGFGNAVTDRKIGQEAVEPGGNRVQGEIGQPALGVI